MSVPEPSKILTPWATTGLKNTIPQVADPVTGKAGFDQGFPAINMIPKEAGGIPPYGRDFNGILFDITKSIQYNQAGGQFYFDAEFAAAIGGYGLNAQILGNDGFTVWRSTVNGNLNDPNTTPTGWVKVASDISSILKLGTAAQKNVGTGAGEIPDMSSFTSTNTVQFLPGGWIFQIVQVPVIPALGGIVVNFPTPFPNSFIGVATAPGATSPNVPGFNTESINKSSIKVWNQSPSAATQIGSILAIGK